VRPYQVGTAAVIVLIAAAAMFDSRRAFSPVEGTSPGDVGSAWYPFWAAAVVALGATLAGYQALTQPQPKEGVFAGEGSVASVLKLIAPMFMYAISFSWLGFYLATGAYMGFFAAFIGRYKPWWSLASALVTPLAIYLLFEIGFRLILPKSVFYPRIPF
jgi:putative tricarboxylic transport membrane protein